MLDQLHRNVLCVVVLALVVSACSRFDETAEAVERSAIEEVRSIAESADLNIMDIFSKPAQDGEFTLSRQQGAGVPSNGKVTLTAEPVGRITGPEDLQLLVAAFAKQGFTIQVEQCTVNAHAALFTNANGDRIYANVISSRGAIDLTTTLTPDHQLTISSEHQEQPENPGCWPTPT